MKWAGIGLISRKWFDRFGNDQLKIDAILNHCVEENLDDLNVADMQQKKYGRCGIKPLSTTEGHAARIPRSFTFGVGVQGEEDSNADIA